MYQANDIADWFLSSIDRDAGDSITHLKLQKIMYYAQAWTMVLLDDPLFEEDFQAWTHGPVVRSVFDRFTGNGWEALPAPDESQKLNENIEELLSEILSSYGDLSAKHLEDLTHQEDPWISARGELSPEARSDAIIPKEHMTEFYKGLYEAMDA